MIIFVIKPHPRGGKVISLVIPRNLLQVPGFVKVVRQAEFNFVRSRLTTPGWNTLVLSQVRGRWRGTLAIHTQSFQLLKHGGRFACRIHGASLGREGIYIHLHDPKSVGKTGRVR